jgi:hypothetical protein
MDNRILAIVVLGTDTALARILCVRCGAPLVRDKGKGRVGCQWAEGWLPWQDFLLCG